MDNNPTAAGEAAPAPQTEANPTPTTNPEPAPAPAPNLHGFTEDQLAEMEKFYSANGGYQKVFDKVKSAISNPQPQPVEKPVENPQSQQAGSAPFMQPQEPVYQPPKGAVTIKEWNAKRYFKDMAEEPEFANISDGIKNGDFLKEMADFGIQVYNQDGTFNDGRIRQYLTLKSQTVPAKPTEAEPNASNAPTVSYTEVGDQITDINQAYKILMEPGNPNMAKAEEFIKNSLNKK